MLLSVNRIIYDESLPKDEFLPKDENKDQNIKKFQNRKVKNIRCGRKKNLIITK